MLLSGSEPLFIPEKCQILCEAKRLGISVKGHIFNSAIYCDFSTSSSLAAALPQHAGREFSQAHLYGAVAMSLLLCRLGGN